MHPRVPTAEGHEERSPLPEPPHAPAQRGRRRRLGEVLVETGAVSTDEVVAAVVEQRLGDERPIGEILVQQGVVAPVEVEHAERLAQRLGLFVTGSSDYHGDGKENRLGENTTEPEVLAQIEEQATSGIEVVRP